MSAMSSHADALQKWLELHDRKPLWKFLAPTIAHSKGYRTRPPASRKLLERPVRPPNCCDGTGRGNRVGDQRREDSQLQAAFDDLVEIVVRDAI